MISYCLVSTLFTPRVRILRRSRRYVLGRDATNQFPLPSKHVSRRHAEIRWDHTRGNGFTIHDLGSKNGTKVNGETFADRRLEDGDRIVIGPFQLTYREYAGDISGLLASADEWENTASLAHDAGVSDGVVFGGAFSGHELLEICPDGEGDKLVEEGATAIGGRIPFSTDGGLIARGHPGGPTGLAQIWEITQQLRGESEKRQVDGAKLGLAHMMGAGSVCVIHILERES